MPSKYILSRLAQTPFSPPSPSKELLHSEWLSDLNKRRENVRLTTKQEMTDWIRQADDALQRAATPAAKRYVWNQFEMAQNGQEEPNLFSVAYHWLVQHRQWGPAKNPLLDWEMDAQYKLPSLLAAATHLPEKHAVQYIADWFRQQQHALNTEPGRPRLLPVQKMKMNPDVANKYGREEPYDQQDEGYNNLVLWCHVLVPALPYLDLLNPSIENVPYLPYPLEHSWVESLLASTESKLHPWILSNGLYAGDFCEMRAHVVDNDHAFKSLVQFVEQIEEPQHKAFLRWDVAHRSENAKTLIQWVRKHEQETYAVFETLGVFSVPAIRQALLGHWFTNQTISKSLELPSDFNLEHTV